MIPYQLTRGDVRGTPKAAIFSACFFSKLPIPGGGAAVSTCNSSHTDGPGSQLSPHSKWIHQLCQDARLSELDTIGHSVTLETHVPLSKENLNNGTSSAHNGRLLKMGVLSREKTLPLRRVNNKTHCGIQTFANGPLLEDCSQIFYSWKE